ncbi:3-deoxy-D-manno-octulosonic acid transferase [Wenyingzhuangia sp. IMCC45533]
MLIYLASLLIKVVALFNDKMKLFVAGRKQTFEILKNKLSDKDAVVWIHASSLGEFEQGRPLIEAIKAKYPSFKIVLTFFSPSGYEVRKDYELADVVCYLPLDSTSNAKQFINHVNPKLAVFIKYEFWPNYLRELSKNKIPTFLISGIFREDQLFFRAHGFWMRKHLKTIQHFFVQDVLSEKLLESIDIDTVTVAGDTRFDRVQKLVDTNKKLPFVNDFKDTKHLLVAGSTWPEDEEQLVHYINNISENNERFIIAPHNITKEGILRLNEKITKKVILFSEMQNQEMKNYDVFIVDTVGILSKIYAYADVAYIGGGYTKSGVHNTLEAATYGLPIVIGPNFKKFKEVQDLVAQKGCVSIDNTNDLIHILKELRTNDILRNEMCSITQQYVASNLGATQKIMSTLSKYLENEK